MKKQNIIRKNYEFQEIIRKNKQTVNKYLVVYQTGNDTQLKIGISISKKLANAVYRNKYRRQVRACLDQVAPWNVKKNIIIMVRKPFFNLSFEKKLKLIKESLERI